MNSIQLDKDPERLEREAAFFDQFYAGEDTEFDPAVFERYRTLSRRGLYSKEFRIASSGDLSGKRVLDVGCGTGGNSVLLARLGATVVGLDVSPVAIAHARALATSAGVEARTTFLAVPLEDFVPEQQFDIVWVDAFLHHMLPIFDETVRLLTALVKPGGCMIVSEPIRTSAIVRAVRKLFPDNPDATPDERPLEEPEIRTLSAHLDFTTVRYFHGVSRLAPLALRGDSYERASATRRALADWMSRADRLLLALPVIREFLGGVVVIVARPKPSAMKR